MAINQLEKIYLIAPRAKKDEILKELQKANIIHFETDLREEIEGETGYREILSQEIDLRISQAVYVIEYLQKFEKEITIQEKLEKIARLISYEDFTSIARKYNIEKIYNEIYNLVKRSKELATEENELRVKMDRLEPYKNLKVNFKDIKNTTQVHMRIGMMPSGMFRNFHLEFEDITHNFQIYKISENFRGNDYFFIAYHKQFSGDIEKLLNRYNFKDEDIKIKATIEDETEAIYHRLDEIDREKKGIVADSKLKADWLDRVKLMYDYLTSVRSRKKVESYIYETRATFALKGWIRKNDRNELEKRISKITDSYELIAMAPGEKDKVPIEMENPAFISPMEFVVSLYGTPHYKEFDPTLFIFPFFLFYFALCLGDTGYALVLIITSIFLLRYFKDSKLLKVILYSSIITIFVGFFTGSIFAIDYKMLPEFIRKNSINLSEHAIEFLAFTIFLGVIQMVLGLFIGARILWGRGEIIEAFEKISLGIFFSCGGPYLLLTTLLNKTIPHPYNSFLINGIICSAIIFLLLRIVATIREFTFEGSILMRVFQILTLILKITIGNTLLTLFNNTMGFLGAALSYSRIMALGLSSAGIGMVVNLLAGLAREIPIPVINYIIALAIIIFGHLINIVLSALGAFVHTARLQYVEFFPHFFEGGGKPFEPFRIKAKYHTIGNS